MNKNKVFTYIEKNIDKRWSELLTGIMNNFDVTENSARELINKWREKDIVKERIIDLLKREFIPGIIYDFYGFSTSEFERMLEEKSRETAEKIIRIFDNAQE